MARRGQKMNLGEFLGDKAAAYIPEAALPTGPRVRAEGEEDSRGGYGDRRGGDRFSDRAPSRSDESGQWRGDRAGGDRGGFGGDRGGYGGDRGGDRFGGREEGGDNWRGGGGDRGGPSRYDRPSRDNFQAEERPAHMRLNLQRRDGAGDEAPRGGAGFNSRGGEEAPRGGDKFASAFGGSSGGSRFGGDRDGGSRFGDRDGGSRFGDRDGGRFGGDRDGGRFGGDRGGDRFGRGDRYDDRDSRGGGYSSSRFGRDDRRDDGPVGGIAAAFQNSMRMTDNVKTVQQEAPVDDKKAQAKKIREERKKKAEEERLAAEEAKRAAAEAKKAAEEAAALKAEGDREIIAEVLESGKLGDDLAKVAKDVFAKRGRPSGAVIFEAVTKKAEAVAKASANWIAPSQYGRLLEFAMTDAEVADQVKALYALQIFLNEHGFPKGVMEKCFMALYTLDIIEDKAFFDYKYDVDSDAPGRMKAIVQLSTWLTWLETPDEEESEEDDE